MADLATITVSFITFVLGPLVLAMYHTKSKKQEKVEKESLNQDRETSKVETAVIDYAVKYEQSLYEQIASLEEEKKVLIKARNAIYQKYMACQLELVETQGKIRVETQIITHQFDLYKEVSVAKIKDLEKQVEILTKENEELRALIKKRIGGEINDI